VPKIDAGAEELEDEADADEHLDETENEPHDARDDRFDRSADLRVDLAAPVCGTCVRVQHAYPLGFQRRVPPSLDGTVPPSGV